MEIDRETRIRIRAHEIWEREGSLRDGSQNIGKLPVARLMRWITKSQTNKVSVPQILIATERLQL
jgi:histone H3/H4